MHTDKVAADELDGLGSGIDEGVGGSGCVVVEEGSDGALQVVEGTEARIPNGC